MNLFIIIFAALMISVHTAEAQDSPAQQGRMDAIIKGAKDLVPRLPSLPSVSLPLPDLSMPDLSQMSDGIKGEFNAFTQQVADSLPLLEQMGYEVSTFRVQWGLPPKAKLRLRSTGITDPGKIAAIAAKATGGVVMSSLVSSAASAKKSRAP